MKNNHLCKNIRSGLQISVSVIILVFSITEVSYQQPSLDNEEEEEESCIDYDATENTITIDCNVSFLDIVQTIDDSEILEEEEEEGNYLLKANLDVNDGATFSMTSNHDGLEYLKIAGANGIIVYGKIQIDGVKITSWDTETSSPVSQTATGSIPRAFINLRGSEGGFVYNSEISHLGYSGSGRRGFDLFGDSPSHDLEIKDSEFHDMWFAFYSNGAYNIIVDGNEYHHNIKYALDPHTGTHDMSITNNYLHHNPIGAICSLNCSNVLIEGNVINHNVDYGIFFSRNTQDSIARNNQIYNVSTGIMISESPNNKIYDNIIDRATSQGIRLQNPVLPDDGFTENNLVYNNTIISSGEGIGATRSNDNILEKNLFSDMASSEYILSGNSGVIIKEQNFDNTLISEEGSATENLVEIVDSGTIEVREEGNDGREDGEDDEGAENSFYNTDNEPYSKILSDGDSIVINSQN